MFDQFLLTINLWMTDTFAVAILGCFLWGMVSVLFSPCHLPLYRSWWGMWQDRSIWYRVEKRRDMLECSAWDCFFPSPQSG